MAKKNTKIKLENLPQLQKELTQLLSEKIAFSTKWEVRNILNSFKDTLENYRNTIGGIYKKYGKEDVETQTYKLESDKTEEANKELQKLVNKEIEIVGKLPLSELNNIKSEHQYFEVFALVEK